MSKRLLQGALRKFAMNGTKFVGARWGEFFPFHYICEYPKSGGTWIGKMVSDVLQLPFPEHAMSPMAFSCVIHSHWTYQPKFQRVVYVYRDGRDVMVSFFFHRMRVIKYHANPLWKYHEEQYERLFGKGYDTDDIVGLLPKFIENEFRNPRDCRQTWVQHVDSWFDPSRKPPHITYVSYEQMLEDPHTHLARIAGDISDKDIEDWRIEMTVEKYSMAKQTGRKPGEEKRDDFIRKGIAGDWKNHFSREAAQVFNDLAGDTLVALGYESDKGWVDRGSFVGEDEPVSQAAAS